MRKRCKCNAADGSSVGKKTGTRIAAVTTLTVVLILLFNILFSIIGDKAMLYIDISEVKYSSSTTALYTLSDDCRELIGKEAVPMIEQFNNEAESEKDAPGKLKIIFCADRDVIESNEKTRYVSYTARAIEKNYPDAIEVEYINITKNPSAVQKYKTTSAASIYPSDVIVEFGSEYLVHSINSFYLTDTDTDDGEAWAYNGEKHLAAMILSVSRVESPLCLITYNHGELLFEEGDEIKVREEYSTFIALVEGAGYEVRFADLEKEDIPEECRMIITFAPTEDFKAFGNLGENGVSEIEKLDKYLDESNSFFYICDADTPALPNLDEYLEEWGIAIRRNRDLADNVTNFKVEDPTNATSSNIWTFEGKYFENGTGAVITQDMRDRNYPPKVIFGNSAFIEPPSESYVKLFTTADETTGEISYPYYYYFKNGVSREMFNIFTTHETASARAGDEVEIATSGNLFSLMTLTHEVRYVQEDNYTSIDRPTYVLALSSTDFVKNEVLNSTAYGNTDVILSALRNLGSETIPANVPLKAFYEYGMEDTNAYVKSNPTVWFWCLALIPTAAVTLTGIVITVRRKYK